MARTQSTVSIHGKQNPSCNVSCVFRAGSLSDGVVIGTSGISSRHISNQGVGILGIRRYADGSSMCRTGVAREDRLGTDDFR